MIAFFREFIVIIFMSSFISADITSPVNYQPIKYYHIHLELNYIINNEMIRNPFDFTNQNILVTVMNSKKNVYVSGRLLLVKGEDSININATSTSSANSACAPITTFSDSQWIALILKGGKCSIKDKLENALLRSNASAVIIMDNSLPRNGEKYELNNEIGLLLGEQLLPLEILRNESIFINASIIVNNYFVDGFISRTSVLFVSISFILLMIISLVWLIFYYIQRFRYMHAKERLSRRLANAAKKALDKIPLKILSPYDNEVSNDYDQCAICIDNYNIGETIRILPCKHVFHKVCIDSWLIEQRSCPMCKVDILKACGVLNLSGSGKARDRGVSSLLNQSRWVRNTTITGTAALLESANQTNELCAQTGHSNFLQRYRERYGLTHCHRSGHRRKYFHKGASHFYEHRCVNHDTSGTSVKVAESVVKSHEHVDLISESDHSIISQHETSMRLSLPNDSKDSKCNPRLLGKEPELVYDICECSSDNTTGECDVCSQERRHNSAQESWTCSCDTCSDCLYVDNPNCAQCDPRRSNPGSGITNLLKCCIPPNSNLNSLQNNNSVSSGLFCCNLCAPLRTNTCRNCDNQKMPQVYKQCSTKCPGHPKSGNCHLKGLQYPQSNPAAGSLRPVIPGQTDQFEHGKRLKSMILMKTINKNGTLDSYNKSSISDDFEFETDNGSSSIELSVPAVKMTVLPPQVQCHQGPPNSDSGNSDDHRAEGEPLTAGYDEDLSEMDEQR